jgi:hypothetical protein
MATLPVAYPGTTGPLTLTNLTVDNLNLTSSTIPTNGLYLPAANTVGIATNGTLRVSVGTSNVTLASGMGLVLTSGNATLTSGNLVLSSGRATISSPFTTEAAAFNVNAQATTANVMLLEADVLTTAGIILASSNSANASARALIRSVNDNSAATGAVNLQLQQDAANAFVDYVGTAGANTTDPISTLTTSGATTHHIQIDINGTKAWIAASTNNPS